MNEEERAKLVARFLAHELEVEKIEKAELAELLEGLAFMFYARVFNCVDPTGERDAEWGALGLLMERMKKEVES